MCIKTLFKLADVIANWMVLSQEWVRLAHTTTQTKNLFNLFRFSNKKFSNKVLVYLFFPQNIVVPKRMCKCVGRSKKVRKF